MKNILISTAIALAIMLLPSAIRAEQRTIENKLTNLTWCFHQQEFTSMPKETAADCGKVLMQLKSHFGKNFQKAMIKHSYEMEKLLELFPEDLLTDEMMYNIIYAKRTDI